MKPKLLAINHRLYMFHPLRRSSPTTPSLSCPSHHFGLIPCLNCIKLIPASGPLHLLVAVPEAETFQRQSVGFDAVLDVQRERERWE